MTNESSFDINLNSNPVQTVAQPKEDKNMLRATDKITALYCRLSVEDTKDEKKNGKEDLSNSIQNQDGICQGDFLQKSTRSQKKIHIPNKKDFILLYYKTTVIQIGYCGLFSK